VSGVGKVSPERKLRHLVGIVDEGLSYYVMARRLSRELHSKVLQGSVEHYIKSNPLLLKNYVAARKRSLKAKLCQRTEAKKREAWELRLATAMTRDLEALVTQDIAGIADPVERSAQTYLWQHPEGRQNYDTIRIIFEDYHAGRYVAQTLKRLPQLTHKSITDVLTRAGVEYVDGRHLNRVSLAPDELRKMFTLVRKLGFK